MPKTYTLPLSDALIRQITDIGNYLVGAYPDAWRNAHNGAEPSGSEFVRRWALACRDAGIDCGINGKRGTDTPSQDVLTLGVDRAGANDTSNTFDWMLIADVIAGAGGPNPSIGWNDVSAASQGRYIVPWLEPHEQPGPAPGPDPDPGPGPGPGPDPTPTPPPHNDAAFVVLNQKLDRVLEMLEEAKHQQAADTDQIGKWMVEQAQGVVAALTNEIQGLNFTCRFRVPGLRGAEAPEMAAAVEEADVDPPPVKTRATRKATHKK